MYTQNLSQIFQKSPPNRDAKIVYAQIAYTRTAQTFAKIVGSSGPGPMKTSSKYLINQQKKNAFS